MFLGSTTGITTTTTWTKTTTMPMTTTTTTTIFLGCDSIEINLVWFFYDWNDKQRQQNNQTIWIFDVWSYLRSVRIYLEDTTGEPSAGARISSAHSAPKF